MGLTLDKHLVGCFQRHRFWAETVRLSTHIEVECLNKRLVNEIKGEREPEHAYQIAFFYFNDFLWQ